MIYFKRLSNSMLVIAIAFSPSAYAFQQNGMLKQLPPLPPLGGMVSLPGGSQLNADQSPNHSASPSISKPRSQTVYKLIMPDGGIAYSDKPIAGAKIEKQLSDGGGGGAMGINFSSTKRSKDKITLLGSTSADQKRGEQIAAAEESLRSAIEQQRAAEVVGENDRSITANKNSKGKRISRLTEQYLDRQVQAEQSVKRAREALEAARAM